MKKDSYRTALVIPDCHIPYHDEKAYRLMLQVAADSRPDEIVILGDFADFYAISSFTKDPRRDHTLIREIHAVNEKLDQLDKIFPKARKIFLEGNHEHRLTRYIASKAPELFGMAATTELFRLSSRPRWTFIEYGPRQRYSILGSGLLARHEPLGGATHAAHNSVVKAGTSVIFGHIHRIQESQIVNINGDNHRGISPGWLGDSSSSVFDYVREHHQWALGFSLVHVLPSGTFFNQVVHIIDYQCMYRGQIYHG